MWCVRWVSGKEGDGAYSSFELTEKQKTSVDGKATGSTCRDQLKTKSVVVSDGIAVDPGVPDARKYAIHRDTKRKSIACLYG